MEVKVFVYLFNIECHLFLKHLSFNEHTHTHTSHTYIYTLDTLLHIFVVHIYVFISTDK